MGEGCAEEGRGGGIEGSYGEEGNEDNACAALTQRNFTDPTTLLLQVSHSDLHLKVYEGDRETSQVGVEKGKKACGSRET